MAVEKRPPDYLNQNPTKLLENPQGSTSPSLCFSVNTVLGPRSPRSPNARTRIQEG